MTADLHVKTSDRFVMSFLLFVFEQGDLQLKQSLFRFKIILQKRDGQV